METLDCNRLRKTNIHVPKSDVLHPFRLWPHIPVFGTQGVSHHSETRILQLFFGYEQRSPEMSSALVTEKERLVETLRDRSNSETICQLSHGPRDQRRCPGASPRTLRGHEPRSHNSRMVGSYRDSCRRSRAEGGPPARRNARRLSAVSRVASRTSRAAHHQRRRAIWIRFNCTPTLDKCQPSLPSDVEVTFPFFPWSSNRSVGPVF